ncbi:MULTISPECIES: GNAT family N-acetyltransferase [Micrococcaceae]|uniref:GNAT family N-acetyltransferase n=1 Tax=Glutamicibacter soli TaxID=453836 RepID=A0A6L9G7U1_9MICC|nr:GNAT family N-acetyltransferase [Glutamicibacter soli]
MVYRLAGKKTPVGFFTATRKPEAIEIGYWVDPQFWGRGIASHMIPQGVS